MAFMVPEYIEDAPYEVEDRHGFETIVWSDLVGDNPKLEDFKDYIEAEPINFERLPRGIIFRLSAPGYLDSTEWGYAKTIEEARQQIEEFWEVDPDTGDELLEED